MILALPTHFIDTIFVHGSIDELTMKFVPPLDAKFELPTSPPQNGTIVEDVHEWVQALNEYLHHGVKDFVDRPQWNEERNSRGGESLLAIQNRPSMWGRSVVCNSFADGGVIYTEDAIKERRKALQIANAEFDPLAFEGIASNVLDPTPSQWLLDHGIQRMVVGHKPTGDCAAVLSSKYTGVEIVAVDTSYSHRKDLKESCKRFGDSRGDAIALVEIVGKEECNWLESFGVLSCCNEYRNYYPILNRSKRSEEFNDVGDPYLGRQLPNSWWVKALTEASNYHLCRGTGRFVEYCSRPMNEVRNELDQRECVEN